MAAANASAKAERALHLLTIPESAASLGARLGTVLVVATRRIVVEVVELEKDGALQRAGACEQDWIEEVDDNALDLMGFFDKDGDGSVTMDELKEALAQIRSFAPAGVSHAQTVAAQARELMQTYDADRSGTLEIEELGRMLNGLILQHVIALLYSKRPLSIGVTRAIEAHASPRRTERGTRGYTLDDALAFARQGSMVSKRGALGRWKSKWLVLAPDAADLALNAPEIYERERILSIASVEGASAKPICVADVRIGLDLEAYGSPSATEAAAERGNAKVDAMNAQFALTNGFRDVALSPYRVFCVAAKGGRVSYFACPDSGMKRWVDALSAVVGKETAWAQRHDVAVQKRASVVSV